MKVLLFSTMSSGEGKTSAKNAKKAFRRSHVDDVSLFGKVARASYGHQARQNPGFAAGWETFECN